MNISKRSLRCGARGVQDYKFARYATDGSSSKVCWTQLHPASAPGHPISLQTTPTRLAHIYDLGGDEVRPWACRSAL